MRPETFLDRLARYDGTGFREVSAGGIGDGVDVVHVFAHGWQPGYRLRERMLATQDGVSALPAWDPRLVDAGGSALIEDYRELLDALAGLGERHAVLWYSWLDESATEADVFQAFRSRQATQINGRRLAVALQVALRRDRQQDRRRNRAGVWPAVHLIGHSHGASVVTHAATSMHRPPEQLTLLDAPEDTLSRLGGANDLIDTVLPRLRPGREAGHTFVDSYASAFGRPYHRRSGLESVVDVLLTVPWSLLREPARAITAAHLYPVEWYARSVREAHRGVGYGWSPLAGADPTSLYSWYYAPLAQRPLLLSRHVGDPLTRFGEAIVERFAQQGGVQGEDPRGAPAVRARPELERRPVPGVCLRAEGRSAAAQVVTTERGDELVEFDLELRGCRGGELVEIEFDGVPVFVARASWPVPRAGRYLMLADGQPGEHLITLRMSGAGRDARAEMTQLHLVAGRRPAPGFSLSRSAATIFGAGAATGAVATLTAVLAGRQMVRAVRRAASPRRAPSGPGRRSSRRTCCGRPSAAGSPGPPPARTTGPG